VNFKNYFRTIQNLFPGEFTKFGSKSVKKWRKTSFLANEQTSIMKNTIQTSPP
jgi:hypothetical protein